MPSPKALTHPYYPIIYLRGYAMTQGEIEDTVATPYMGFNLGSTKIKQEWDRSISGHIFESPLVRLMKDYEYHDTYENGKLKEGPLDARSVIVYRYYDNASKDLGNDRTLSIPEAASGLSELILKVQDQVCGNDTQARANFKVYLVAHSMGGLVCRCFLQNDSVGNVEAKALVDKVFTYGTPHNGIDLRGMNVPSWFGFMDADNFSRKEIRKYLELPATDRVDSLNDKFDPEKFFCLVGTNHKDYSLARFAVGPMSDGLVKIDNAAIQGAPRAYVHRSHSGHFGLVNSEEGYQNLVRFLFGDTFVSASMHTQSLPLPPRVKAARDNNLSVRSSYLFESTVTPRGSFDVNLTERRADEASAIFRSYDELMRPENLNRDKPRTPVLFSVFLDSSKIEVGKTMVFSIKLSIKSTDYQILESSRRYPAETIFDEAITIRATINNNTWRLRYVMSDQWSESKGKEIEINPQTGVAEMPVSNKKGYKGTLNLTFNRWNG